MDKRKKGSRYEDEYEFADITAGEYIPEIKPVIEKTMTSETVDLPLEQSLKYFMGAIVMCDANLTYVVIDTFKNSCVVEPIENNGCFASEIMSFKAMEEEGWKVIGKQI
jgi:hypothetical protein